MECFGKLGDSIFVKISVALNEILTATSKPFKIVMWKGLKLRWGTQGTPLTGT